MAVGCDQSETMEYLFARSLYSSSTQNAIICTAFFSILHLFEVI
jgi:hypothetical protein